SRRTDVVHRDCLTGADRARTNRRSEVRNRRESTALTVVTDARRVDALLLDRLRWIGLVRGIERGHAVALLVDRELSARRVFRKRDLQVPLRLIEEARTGPAASVAGLKDVKA